MRTLSSSMIAVQSTYNKKPTYKILAYDPAVDNISAVVRGTATQTPFDATEYCLNVSWNTTKISFTLVDSDGIFHPDTGANRNYFSNNATIRLIEGYEGIDESEWVASFTGQIHGQVGWRNSRRTKSLESKITVYSRESSQALSRRLITTNEYTIGTDIGVAVYDLCVNFIGLDPTEVRIPTALGYQFMHLTNQLSQVSPWQGINSLLETVGMVPFFDGDGKLTVFNKSLNRAPNRTFELTDIYDYEIPENVQDGINKIIVTFLSASLSKITGDTQVLGTANITTGFFTGSERLECWWSEDRRQRAENTWMHTLKGINDNLIPFIGTESYSESSEFGGVISISISVWVPILATVMVIIYVVMSFIPDFWAGMFFGVTIPWGRVIQSIALLTILILMMSLGSAQYEIVGTPFDYAYKELKSIAIEDGLAYWEENEKEIRNDFIGNYEQADYIAFVELCWEKTMEYSRRLLVVDDLALERGDIVVVPDGRKFVIMEMSKTLVRGEVPVLTIDCYKVMAG
jgi:hypothetical protein